MKIRPDSNLSRADAEKLLDGGTVGAPRLEQLISAASVPVANEPGEGIAVAAFHRAGETPAPPHRRFYALKTAFAASVSAKIIAGVAVAAAATGGGIALVSSQSALHANSHANPHATSSSAVPSASPSPNQVGLCTAYKAGVATSNGKALDNPAFQSLVTAASPGTVDDYCSKVLANAPSATHPTAKPTDLPTQATDHPSGKPTDHPTGKPTDRPGGASSSTS